jgi:hypothetical protein
MKRLVSSGLILFLACAFSPLRVEAHKFHASFATLNYNEQSKSVEVTMRIFPDDLEAALSKQLGRSVKLEKSKESSLMIMNYLRKTFELKQGGRVQTFRWVGMELGVDSAWLYFEAKLPAGIVGAQIRNQFLCELFDDQTNVVSIKYRGKQLDQVFRRNDEFKRIP